MFFDALKNTKTFTAKFKQEQVSNSGKPLIFTGSVVFSRPNRLKWEILQPYVQLQLLRGKEFLIYDPDLEQVSVSELKDDLNSTPAGLLFNSGPNAETIFKKKYNIFTAPSRQNLNWILAIPKGKEENSSSLEVGVRNTAVIEQIITTDIFGKVSKITFSDIQTNKTIKESQFIPIIPKGVEYIEQ
jgi:outer membrane lipoprotein carrier protein